MNLNIHATAWVEIFYCVTPSVPHLLSVAKLNFGSGSGRLSKGYLMNKLLSPQSDAYQLPNPLREAMLGAGYAKGLVVLEGLYMLRIKADSWLHFDEIFRLCRDNFGMSRRLIYDGLCQNLIFQRRKAEVKSHQRGARPYLYRVPYPEELLAEFQIPRGYTPHDQLEKDDLKSVKAYRLGLHREMFIRKSIDAPHKGFVMSRKLMADRLGVSPRTVRDYDKILGFSHQANYREERITVDNWFKLPRYKDKFDADGKRLPSKMWLKAIKSGDENYTLLPQVRYLAYKALQEGYQVWTVERLPNTYFPYQKPDLSQCDGWEYFYADGDALNAAGFFKQNDSTWIYHRDKFLSYSPATAYANFY